MRIVNVDNLQIRRYGRPRMACGRSLACGMVRNNWRVWDFSERDIAKFESPLGLFPIGKWMANRRLIETCDNFKPDLILIGHCEIIQNRTLMEIRKLLPNVRIAFRIFDALWEPWTVTRIRERMPCVDAIFVTTGGSALREYCTGKNVVAYFPNPTDPAVEDQDNSRKTNFDRDVVFCGCGNETDARHPFVGQLHQALQGQVRFETFGMHGGPIVWGKAYDDILAGSKMGLNLNRFEDWPLYSSDRIAQLMGNGLLTCLWDKGNMRRFFGDEHVAYFSDMDGLVRRILEFQHDDAKRQTVAAAGRSYYHEHFSGQRVMKFIVETTLGLPYSHDYLWANEVYRDRQ